MSTILAHIRPIHLMFIKVLVSPHLLYVAMPRGPMQLVLMTSCLASLFLHLSFLVASLQEVSIPHDMFYTYSFLHLKGTFTKDKGYN